MTSASFDVSVVPQHNLTQLLQSSLLKKTRHAEAECDHKRMADMARTIVSRPGMPVSLYRICCYAVGLRVWSVQLSVGLCRRGQGV